VHIDNAIARLDILLIEFRFCFPSVQVIEGMIADSMTSVDYFSENIRMLTDVIANTKKRGFRRILSKRLDNKFRWTRNRAVVKRQVKFFCRGFYFPGETWI
jgi:hypothetical protein